uniref:Uncharacterized protein n=1 Tax=Anguilla anguilla TaxID=7936 RepID=A0A0E9SDV2_ANGAN
MFFARRTNMNLTLLLCAATLLRTRTEQTLFSL